MDVLFHKPVEQPIFSFTVRTPDGRIVYDTTTRWQGLKQQFAQDRAIGSGHIDLDVALLDGEYELGADVIATDFGHYYDRIERAQCPSPSWAMKAQKALRT